jgi:putative lipoic acid-binding regulatory protein
MALVEAIFDEDADIHHKESSAGKYISITVKQVVMNVDEIIFYYEQAAKIEGVISL